MTQRDPTSLVARLTAAGCVFAEDEAELLIAEAGDDEQLDELVRQRTSGTPLEHIVGWTEFFGLRVSVRPGVFVPRPRTEFLVEQALAYMPPGSATVVDLCCGSGAIGLAMCSRRQHAHRRGVQLHAVDIDPVAAQCARANMTTLDAAIDATVYEGDLYDVLPNTLRKSVDVVVANAPYVPTDEIAFLPREARDYEPHIALDGGPAGVDVQQRICAEAADWLKPQGHLLVETSAHQAEVTADLFRRYGLSADIATCPELDATVVVGSNLQ